MANKTAGQSIIDLPTGIFATICKVKPMGGLQVRKGAAGAVSLYWRYSIGASSPSSSNFRQIRAVST